MMQLWYAPTSPFARKVLIAAHELGLAGQLQLIEVDPWKDGRLRQINPLAKVPTLVLEIGENLFESSVICEFLDALAPQPRLFPPAPARWRALLMQGLADGAATAAGRLFAEERKAPEQQSSAMVERFRQAIDAALDEMERRGMDPGLVSIGDVSTAAFLGYLDFRWPHRDWRGRRPGLAQAFAIAQQRPSMSRTEHRALTQGI